MVIFEESKKFIRCGLQFRNYISRKNVTCSVIKIVLNVRIFTLIKKHVKLNQATKFMVKNRKPSIEP